MPTIKRYIPLRDDDFFNWQGKLVNKVVANATGWGIPSAPVTTLVNRRAEYEPLYLKSQEKGERTRGDVSRHRNMRKIYEKELRDFSKEYLMFNSKVSRDERIEMGLTDRDTEPTPRAKIELTPYVNLKAVASGVIEVRSQTEKDATRVSMLKIADGIECRYTIVPKGEMPPAGYEDAKNSVVSRKARFSITVGDKNSGDSFYGFFRWVNQSVPANSGPWTKAMHMVIA